MELGGEVKLDVNLAAAPQSYEHNKKLQMFRRFSRGDQERREIPRRIRKEQKVYKQALQAFGDCMIASFLEDAWPIATVYKERIDEEENQTKPSSTSPRANVTSPQVLILNSIQVLLRSLIIDVKASMIRSKPTPLFCLIHGNYELLRATIVNVMVVDMPREVRIEL